MTRISQLAAWGAIATVAGCSNSSHRLGGGLQTINDGGGARTAEGSTGGAPDTGGAAGERGVRDGSLTSGSGGVTGSGGTLATTDTGVPGTGGAATGRDGSLGSPTVGEWDGYTENFHFISGSDAVKLTLDSFTPGHVSGHIVLGSGPDTQGSLDPYQYYGRRVPADGFQLVEGYRNTIANVTLEGERLQFDILSTEPWQAWCAAQPSLARTMNPGYSCYPDTSRTYDFSQDGKGCWIPFPGKTSIDQTCFFGPDAAADAGNCGIEVGCMNSRLCQIGGGTRVDGCLCDAQACALQSAISFHFDMRVGPANMDGSFVPDGANVHLFKH
jgi:hypothetical protein